MASINTVRINIQIGRKSYSEQNHFKNIRCMINIYKNFKAYSKNVPEKAQNNSLLITNNFTNVGDSQPRKKHFKERFCSGNFCETPSSPQNYCPLYKNTTFVRSFIEKFWTIPLHINKNKILNANQR